VAGVEDAHIVPHGTVLRDDPLEPDWQREPAEVNDVAVLGVVVIQMGLPEIQFDTSYPRRTERLKLFFITGEWGNPIPCSPRRDIC